MGDVSRDRSDERDILSLTLSSVLKSNQLTNPRKVSFSSNDLENMTSQLKTFYFAGHDTTATTIAWAFWLLVQHPTVLQRAREEVVTHIGKEWETQARLGCEMSETTYDALQKCEYLDAVARETLRLYPPAASTRIITDSHANAGGYRLGNAIIHLNFYAIQRDPDVWEDADSFIPDRFLGEEGKKMIASSSFLPFSKGMRDCIGRYFALLETKIALAILISRYDAIIVDEVEIYASRLTSIPIGGCKVKLHHRTS
jgi:cytochrome P450